MRPSTQIFCHQYTLSNIYASHPRNEVDVMSWLRNEAREIRTPNLLIWSQTRCRCAIAPLGNGQWAWLASTDKIALRIEHWCVITATLIVIVNTTVVYERSRLDVSTSAASHDFDSGWQNKMFGYLAMISDLSTKLAMNYPGYSSVGRASDCRMLQQSDGPWFDSGWPDLMIFLMATTRLVVFLFDTLEDNTTSVTTKRLHMQGLFWELNPGPLAPWARIIPLDQTARW